MTVGRVLTVAAMVVLSACGSADPASTSTSTPETTAASCTDAIDAAVAFIHRHPEGPVRLDTRSKEELSDHVDAVDRACNPDQATEFGTDVLEPWSARRAGNEPGDGTTASSTTVTRNPAD